MPLRCTDKRTAKARATSICATSGRPNRAMDPKPKPKQDNSIIYVGKCTTSPPSSSSLSLAFSCQGNKAFSRQVRSASSEAWQVGLSSQSASQTLSRPFIACGCHYFLLHALLPALPSLPPSLSTLTRNAYGDDAADCLHYEPCDY